MRPGGTRAGPGRGSGPRTLAPGHDRDGARDFRGAASLRCTTGGPAWGFGGCWVEGRRKRRTTKKLQLPRGGRFCGAPRTDPGLGRHTQRNLGVPAASMPPFLSLSSRPPATVADSVAEPGPGLVAAASGPWMDGQIDRRADVLVVFQRLHPLFFWSPSSNLQICPVHHRVCHPNHFLFKSPGPMPSLAPAAGSSLWASQSLCPSAGEWTGSLACPKPRFAHLGRAGSDQTRSGWRK